MGDRGRLTMRTERSRCDRAHKLENKSKPIMKVLYAPLVLALAALDIVDGITNHQFSLRRLNHDEDGGDYILIASDDAETSACVQVRNDHPRKNQRLVLGDCESEKPGWRLDNDGLFHTELDDDWCLQAGKRGAVKDGEFARMRKCDATETLQEFEWRNGGGIRPKSNDSLCLVWRGVHPNVGVDPLIFKDCNDVKDRNDWSGN